MIREGESICQRVTPVTSKTHKKHYHLCARSSLSEQRQRQANAGPKALDLTWCIFFLFFFLFSCCHTTIKIPPKCFCHGSSLALGNGEMLPKDLHCTQILVPGLTLPSAHQGYFRHAVTYFNNQASFSQLQSRIQCSIWNQVWPCYTLPFVNKIIKYILKFGEVEGQRIHQPGPPESACLLPHHYTIIYTNFL